jgi:hypothetical protein
LELSFLPRLPTLDPSILPSIDPPFIRPLIRPLIHPSIHPSIHHPSIPLSVLFIIIIIACTKATGARETPS